VKDLVANRKEKEHMEDIDFIGTVILKSDLKEWVAAHELDLTGCYDYRMRRSMYCIYIYVCM
jgi:hypothetical protein